MNFQKVSVIVPVYNEEAFVEEAVKELLAMRLPHDLAMEVIVVDDGSTDRTRSILKQLGAAPSLQVYYQAKNAGKGAAVREGLRHATGEIVVIHDADREYSVADYPKLLEPFFSQGAQAVYGSRFLGEIRGMRLRYRLFNQLIRALANGLYGAHITDEATAYKALKTDLMRSLDLRGNPIGDGGLQYLTFSSRLKGLSSLFVGHCGLGDLSLYLLGHSC